MKGSDLVQEKYGEKVVLLVRSLGGRIFPTPPTTAIWASNDVETFLAPTRKSFLRGKSCVAELKN